MRRGIARRASWLLALAAVCVASAAGAPVASAVILHLRDGRTVSYQPVRGAAAPLAAAPFASGKRNLLYHGGPVMPSNANYTFYWAPSGSAPYATGYQDGIDTYLQRLSSDSGGDQNVDSVSAQYTDAGGEAASYSSTFAGRIVDTNPYPANGCVAAAVCLTDAQIQSEVRSYVEAHGLPADLRHEYFVLTPPGVESCFEATSTECSAGTAAPAYCAYHGDIAATSGKIIYADDPYVVGVEGCDRGEGQRPSESPAEAALQGGLSHEHNESITDPELNAWSGPEGYENGDKCRTLAESSELGTPLGTAPDGSPYNQVVGGGLYLYQQEWSNIGRTCLQRLAPSPPVVSKLSPKKGPAAGGTVVTITGSGFTGVTEVLFGGVKAAYAVGSASSISATSPPGAPGTVGITVVAEHGSSAPSKKARFKYTKK